MSSPISTCPKCHQPGMSIPALGDTRYKYFCATCPDMKWDGDLIRLPIPAYSERELTYSKPVPIAAERIEDASSMMRPIKR